MTSGIKTTITVLALFVGPFIVQKIVSCLFLQSLKWLTGIIIFGLISISFLFCGMVVFMGAFGLFWAPTLFGKALAVFIILFFGWFSLFSGCWAYFAGRVLMTKPESKPHCLDKAVMRFMELLTKIFPPKFWEAAKNRAVGFWNP